MPNRRKNSRDLGMRFRYEIMLKNKVSQIEKYVKKVIKDKIAHGFKHVDRVRNWALCIAKREGYKNLEVVEVDKENNLIAIKGAIPGRRGTLIMIKTT